MCRKVLTKFLFESNEFKGVVLIIVTTMSNKKDVSNMFHFLLSVCSVKCENY